jgi:hypothetical protein
VELEIMSSLTQFGTAGLIGAMWLLERRLSADRERQLREAHEKIMSERRSLDLALEVLTSNTRALASLEASQRELAEVLRGKGGA